MNPGARIAECTPVFLLGDSSVSVMMENWKGRTTEGQTVMGTKQS